MAINKLTALNRGNPLNSNGAQLVESVNCIIDEIETSLPAAIDAVSVRTTTLEGDVTNIEAEIADLDNQFIKLEEEINLEAQSKASFLANAEQRKREYAGSGFVEWGKHFPDSVPTVENINQGLFTDVAKPNILIMGDSNSTAIGDSRTGEAISIVDGVELNIKTHGEWSNIFEDRFVTSFPPAPNGTKTYDSATGVVTEHASAAEAFAGLAGTDYNSNFRKMGSTALTTFSGSEITFSATVAAGFGAQLDVVWAGNGDTVYTLEFDYDISQGSFDVIVYGVGAHDGRIISNTSGSGHISLTFFPNQNSGNFATDNAIYFFSGNTQLNGTIANIQLREETESVITSRKDLAFLETWHEKISDKDQVYPLGNVQYGATTYEGITLATRNDGYTRFGEWDTTTTGRYSTWSTLTETEKRAYINDPDNNIYYDSDADELIQVRYRVRVVEGLGDDWSNVVANEISDLGFFGILVNGRIGVRGTSITIADYVAGSNTSKYTRTRATSGAESEIGRFVVFTAQNSHTTCFAVPIALVQR